MHYQSYLLSIYNLIAVSVYPYIPFTYYWYLKTVVGRSGETILDLGCGWGEPMQVLQNNRFRKATGVDIFPNYLKICKERNIYASLINADIFTYKPKKKFDIVICSHVIEHFTKRKGSLLLSRIANMAEKKVVITVPVGNLPQAAYDGNSHQEHLSVWHPEEFRKKGFKVIGVTPRFLFGSHDRFKELNVFAFLLFFVALLLQPFYASRPEECIYMLCIKNN